MNRRSFLRTLLLAPAAAAVDPDLLKWKPGERLISIPKRFGMSEMGYAWRENGHTFYQFTHVANPVDLNSLGPYLNSKEILEYIRRTSPFYRYVESSIKRQTGVHIFKTTVSCDPNSRIRVNQG